jgi:hypothetical protein
MTLLNNLAAGLLGTSAMSRVIGAIVVAALLWTTIAWAVVLP